MCNQYDLSVERADIIGRFKVAIANDCYKPNAQIRPTDPTTIVRRRDGERQMDTARWGLIPSWSKTGTTDKPQTCARCEGIETKPTFRAPFIRQRCILPAQAFYEWTQSKPKIKHTITVASGDLFGIAGLYDYWPGNESKEPILSCTMITTSPNEIMAPIHSRMPVILLPEHEATWLEAAPDETELLLSLLKPFPANLMKACGPPGMQRSLL
jgi:putative SOS response-associated peptidase YedK